MIDTVRGKSYIWNGNSLYLQEAGVDYGTFCGKDYPYNITYVDNQDPIIDKTFTNIEFRANVDKDNGIPINMLETWNEY